MFNRIIIIYPLFLIIFPMMAFAKQQSEANPEAAQIIPIIQCENLNLTSQSIESTSAGVLIKSNDIQFAGMYTHHDFKEPLLYYFPSHYHSIDLLLDGKHNRHQYIGFFKSESDHPVSGGINTYQAAAVYGYELIDNSNLSLVLGAGLALGNFDFDSDIIPVPLIRLNYHADWLDAKFEFLTSSNLSFTLAPENRVRFRGDVRVDQVRDMRDIIFECALEYRPYFGQNEKADFMGLSIGFKNDNYGAFNLGDKDENESIEIHYNSLFAEVDVSVLKITTGYAFDGRALYRETEKQDLGEGIFITVQAKYCF